MPADDVASLLVSFTFCQNLRIRDQAMQARLEQLAHALVLYTRRTYTGEDCIHYMRLVLAHTELRHYSKRLTEEEFLLFERAKFDRNVIAMLSACLATEDPYRHVAGKDSDLLVLPSLPGADGLKLESAKVFW
jgi:hypothetical protein